jgi:hypothetical protein|eukprot:COSAG01_NODE_7381_length_3230_cov_1.541999_4_plen_68_part_00
MNVDPGCKGGVTRWEEGRALVFANAGSCTGRVDTTVRLSLGAAAVVSFLAAVLTEIYLCGVCSCQKY